MYLHLSLIAAAAVLSSAPGDPTTVGPELIDVYTSMPEAQDLCDAYGNVIDAVDETFGYSSGNVMVEAAQAYIIVTVEGDSMRLDNEARDHLVAWLETDCS